MKMLDAVYTLLKDEGKPLHYTVIAEEIVRRGLYQTQGHTLSTAVSSDISENMTLLSEKGENSRFCRVKTGVYGLSEWYK
ncbi:winged helix-turn-helix domain-containing protein [Methanoculleus taiwanensis]|nr:winged helix-turn-helix domain-containing protein [Methanoculleus taiwanensis]